MPMKWKIFFALNFVLSLPALICFIFLFINLINTYNRSSDYFIAFLFLFCLLMISLNGFLNIYLMQRFFPDKLIPESVRRLNTLSLVLNTMIAIGILIFCVYGASLEFSYGYEGRDTTGKIALAIVFVLWIVQVIILVMQGRLPRLISQNNHEKMKSLIDSIGKQQNQP